MHVYGNLGGAADDKGTDRASERLGLFADGSETKGENRGSGYARVINGDLFMEIRYSGGGLNAFAKSGNPVALQGRPFGSVNHDRSLMSRYIFSLSNSNNASDNRRKLCPRIRVIGPYDIHRPGGTEG